MPPPIQPSPPQTRTPRRSGGVPLWLIVLGLVMVWALVLPTLMASNAISIPYSRFLTLVDNGQVMKASIGSQTVSGTYTSGGREVMFVTTRPPGVDEPQLLRDLAAHHVEFSGTQASGFWSFVGTMLVWLLPVAIIIGFWVYMMRRMGQGAAGAMSLGKSQHRVVDRRDLLTSFKDVAGVDEAVAELREVVDFLTDPKRYQRLGGRIPKGVLLVGPPGTGKTLLARAVAGEAAVPFFYISGSNFVQMFVGLGAARVRDLFDEAKAKAPCIVFIDELDTIGRSRGGAMAGTGAHEEHEQTLNQLLSEMDGFDPSRGVIIMAATNRPEVLDPALLRPGRFDRQIVVDLPDRRGREAILQVHARGVALSPDVDLEALAARTPGAAGAELANIINEAALLAARKDKQSVEMSDLEEAVDRVSMGLERRSRVISKPERERVAYHELGHALTALSCLHADPVHRVSIVPRGVAAIGITQQVPAEDRYLITQPELEDRLTVLMGGRAAERIVYGELSTGAQNDLQQATALARRMVEEFGMSDRIGPVTLAQPSLYLRGATERREAVSQEVAAAADAEIRQLVEHAEARATDILHERRSDLDKVARILLDRETLERADLEAALVGDAPGVTSPVPERSGTG